jgi:Alpha/beta hydrolase family
LARFVLVHGAWHGSWCFERVEDELRRRGHEVSAPDLPCDRPGLTVHDYASVVGDDAEAVVVGHSLAGLTIPFVESRVTVFLAALVPIRDAYDGLDPTFVGTVRDELGRSCWRDFETCHASLYPELTEEDARKAFALLRPQAPLQPDARVPTGRCASIVTLRDRAVRPDWQLEQARSLLQVEPLELDAGHSPFFTHPVELVDLLESVL